MNSNEEGRVRSGARIAYTCKLSNSCDALMDAGIDLTVKVLNEEGEIGDVDFAVAVEVGEKDKKRISPPRL